MKIIVIGGVAAGMSAAAKAKRVDKNAEIIVYERGEYISYGSCGIPYYISGITKDFNSLIQRTPEDFYKKDIKVKTNHEVIKVFPKENKLIVKNLKNGEVFEDNFDKLMVASGASAIVPPIKGKELKNVYTLKTLEDSIKLKKTLISKEIKKVAIVGGGYIGVELAESMVKLNKEVCIIEAGERVLNVFDKEISELVQEELRSKGVQIRVKEKVEELIGEEYVKAVKTSENTYNADIVIMSIGVRPNTEFLKDSGIELTEKGAVIIDNYMRTNYKNIYSAGDCAVVYHRVLKENTYIALATTANKMGKIAGENMAGGSRSFPGTLGSSMLKVMKLQAAMTGISEAQAKAKGINYETNFIKAKNHVSYYPDQTDLYIKIIYEKDTHRLLGAQTLGKDGAALRIGVFAAAIYNDMTLEEIALMDLGYTPPYATAWDAVNISAEATI
ncbi:CoA-disulfide reductase [Clostridium polynesiense]|uniref:CoA-disulfide reductase n=1 Tax=Clostridium polynesiense TaxID=1325933 RepID=UPI00058C0A0F|nr:CoA-disulfide reductase [Clostridium polynesiense]